MRRSLRVFQLSLTSIQAKDATAPKKKGSHVKVSASVMQNAFAKPKSGGEEKFGQTLLEYIAETATVPNDPKKRSGDVERERHLSGALERVMAVADAKWDRRMEVILRRQHEALEALPEEFLDDATALDSSVMPLNMTRPRMTAPLPEYEPGFGLDVPQLKAETPEYPHPTNDQPVEYTDVSEVRAYTNTQLQRWEDALGNVRKEYPFTGPEGEQYEMYCYLNIRALKRQLLLLDIAEDPEGLGEKMKDATFAQQEREKRGISPLQLETSDKSSVDVVKLQQEEDQQRLHWGQEPKYYPFRDK
eukprot:PhF_6_TR2171/c0_g1_i1/m.3547